MRKLVVSLGIVFLVLCAFSGGADAFTSYSQFEAAWPPTVHGTPIITHVDPWRNYCPVGWVVDPTDNTKFLLYIHKFDWNYDAGAHTVIYRGDRSDPFTVTFLDNALVPGGGGAWDAWGHFTSGNQIIDDGGTIKAMFGGRNSSSDYHRIGYASSTDGRTFTKYAGNPVLIPPTDRDADDGFVSGIFAKVSGTYYFYVMNVNRSPLTISGHLLTYSSDGLSWTYDGTVILPMGSPGEKDSYVIEGGQMIQMGSDLVVIYPASYIDGASHEWWSFFLAHTTSPTTPVTKSATKPIFTYEGTAWIGCPLLANVSGNRWILYYQKSTSHDPVTMDWTVEAAEFTVPGGGTSGFHGASLRGGAIR